MRHHTSDVPKSTVLNEILKRQLAMSLVCMNDQPNHSSYIQHIYFINSLLFNSFICIRNIVFSREFNLAYFFFSISVSTVRPCICEVACCRTPHIRSSPVISLYERFKSPLAMSLVSNSNLVFLFCLRSIRSHSDHFVQHPSVCPSVCPVVTFSW